MTTRGHWVVFYDFMTLGDIILVSYVHDPWLNKYIYIYLCSWCLMVIGSLCVCMFVFGSVIMKLVVWITTCFFVLTCPPLQVSVCVFGSAIMILVVWITACFFVLNCPHPSRFQFKHDYSVYVFCLVQQSWYLLFELQHVFLFWTAPTPPGFNLSMTTVCMCFVWFNNHDTCCLNYSMFFVLNCPHPSRFQFKHDYSVYVFCLVQ